MVKTDNYKNKTVVITGGTKGIGLGITKAYLSLSAKVIILARNKPKKQIQVKGNKALFYQITQTNQTTKKPKQFFTMTSSKTSQFSVAKSVAALCELRRTFLIALCHVNVV